MILQYDMKLLNVFPNNLCCNCNTSSTPTAAEIKWQPPASITGTCSHGAQLSKVLPRKSNVDNDDNNNKCQHLMFNDRFFPVAIFISVRPLSSPARLQSRGVSHMENLSKQLIWFSMEHKDCKFIMFLSAPSDLGALHQSDPPLKEFLISILIISL